MEIEDSPVPEPSNYEIEEGYFWRKCHDILLIPRLHIKNPILSRELLSILKGFPYHKIFLLKKSLDAIEFKSSDGKLPIRHIVDKVLSRVFLHEFIMNWRQCCLFKLKTMIKKYELTNCSHRFPYLAPSEFPGNLCKMCLEEGVRGDTEPVNVFDIERTREMIQTSSTSDILDTTVAFIVPLDLSLIGLGEYVKQQLLNLLHHDPDMQLSRAERDCLEKSILHLYGSSVTGLQISSVESDIDIMIQPPSTVRVANITDWDTTLDQSLDSDDENESNNKEDNDLSIDERRARISGIANRELKELLEQLIRKAEKARNRPNTSATACQKSARYLDFLASGLLIVNEFQTEEIQQSVSEPLKASHTKVDLKSSDRPEVDLLKLVEKMVRRYGSKYGIFFEKYLRHIRVPLLSVRIKLPSNHQSPDSAPVICGDITLFKSLPLKNTAYICTYLNWDQTSKLKSLILLVKRFVQANEIHGASKGYLSSYSWVMLVFHFLLRLQLIPPLSEVDSEHESRNNDQEVPMFSFSLQLNSYATLETVSVSKLFKYFLLYYSSQIDLVTNVITLRGNGEVLDKSIWKTKWKPWRLSIEDPFERADSLFPHDLGGSLRLQGQTKMFQILEAGYKKMVEIEKLCSLSEVSESGNLFHSLFDTKLSDSHPPNKKPQGSRNRSKRKKGKGKHSGPVESEGTPMSGPQKSLANPLQSSLESTSPKSKPNTEPKIPKKKKNRQRKIHVVQDSAGQIPAQSLPTTRMHPAKKRQERKKTLGDEKLS